MALIKCPECGEKISDKAASCPHCGAPVERPMSTIESNRRDFGIGSEVSDDTQSKHDATIQDNRLSTEPPTDASIVVSDRIKKRVKYFLETNENFLPEEYIPELQERLSEIDAWQLEKLEHISFKSPTTMLIISIFLGLFGVDRFMMGDIVLGCLKFLLVSTRVGFIWWIIDIFLVKKKTRKSNYKKLLKNVFLEVDYDEEEEDRRKKKKYTIAAVIVLILAFVGIYQMSKDEETSSGDVVAAEEMVTKSSGNINGHDYVDLGLSVKWATCNVGASRPEGYGGYYAWGEIFIKSEYTAENCTTFEKDIADIKGKARDVAHVAWGDTWQMPSKTECEELVDSTNCSWKWTTLNGVFGCKVTSKKNGNSIFLPAAGYYASSHVDFEKNYGGYWCSTPKEKGTIILGDTDFGTQFAYGLEFDCNGESITSNGSPRERGCSVRPVSK